MKFPKVVYVIATDDDDNQLLTDEDPRELAVADDCRPMARYTLAGVGEIANQSTYTEIDVEE